jgi:hypothetical protein
MSSGARHAARAKGSRQARYTVSRGAAINRETVEELCGVAGADMYPFFA